MRLGVIGCGGRGSGMVAQVVKACPAARVVGVVDPDEAGARSRLPEADRNSARFLGDVATLIRETKPDAVLVGTRCDLHARYGTELAQYGLPVFLEKPVATNLDDALRLERAWGAKDGRVVVSFPLRVTPLALQAGRWLAEPKTGRISHVQAVNYVTYGDVYFTNWYRDYRITQGLFLQKATHDFDYLANLVGSPIVRVAAMALHGRVHQDVSVRVGAGEADVYYHEQIGTPETGMNEDCSSALIQFANGIHGTYSQVFFARQGVEARGATFCGQRATVRFDWYTSRVERLWHDQPLEESMLVRPSGGHLGGDEALARNFVDLVAGRAPSVAPLRAGLESVYACLAAKESARSNQFVTVRRWGQ